MARKKKYDTEALVGQLKAERRTGLILSMVAVVILFFLVGLFFAGSGDTEPPEIPTGTAADIAANRGLTQSEIDASPAGGGNEIEEPTTAGDEASAETADEDPEAEEPEEELEPEEATGPATVNISMNRKGVVWVDGKKIGKLRKKTMELEAGEHTIKAKFGRKTVQQKIDVEAGASYNFAVDGRRRRATLKKIE